MNTASSFKTTARRRGTALLFGTTSALMFGSAVAAQDTLVVGRSMDVNSLDPSRAFCDTCQIYLTAVYEPLITLGADNETLEPKLAASWEHNEDFTEFTFNLNPDAVFSDGSPVEASDVVWTFERLRNLKGSPSFLMDGTQSIEAVDGHTVKVTVEAPNSEFLNKVSAPYTGILNAEAAMAGGALADETAATADGAEGWFLENSVGSGPFVLANYAPEDELRLSRNDSYYGSAPAFSEVVITQMQDSVSQAQALETGSVDIAMQIDADTAKSLDTPDVVTEIIPSFNFVYFAFMPGSTAMKDKLTPQVREALTYAVDYDGMIEFTVGGNGNKIAAPIPNGFPGTKNLEPRAQDVEKAKSMLAEAGMDSGLEMVAVYPNDNVYGVDLNVMMQKLQQDFSQVGVEVTLKPVTYPVWREEMAAGTADLTAVYYAPDYYGSGQYAAYFGMTEGSTWVSRAGYQSPETVLNEKEGEIYAQALAASGEEAAAKYEELARELMADNVIIPLVSPNLVLAHRADIDGVRYSACCNLPLAEISRK
ncbi:ABC transporter substrate-binding protein [Sulfitobacter faviae]|uniref:ABC transporter substrate-binding protein n=1 Tax=Sulfitobacter faviae TaxID=1775881 RepID=UPI0023078340|nr:ABC transporter substrate-binding protein [Sulfitobacter faviae]WCE66008.1 ABC transporter substrate-binding protein [Sulfitobacter faviae]